MKKTGADQGALAPDEKLLSEDKFETVTPEPSRPLIKERGANEVPAEPVVQPAELAAPVDASNGGVLNHRVVPPPPTEFPAKGGEVQQARLIKSVSPLYPAIARSSHIMGDVLVDALIDTAGRVTTIKIVSGPVMLRQPAIQALREWKYEPAQLNGQPVEMHLSLVVKFRLE
jgi:TonB family protein